MAILSVAISTLTNRLVHEYGLGVLLQGVTEPISSNQFRDQRLLSSVLPADHFRGAWVRSLGASTYGEVRQVSDYDPLTGVITVYPPFSTTIMTGSTVEIWFLYDPSNLSYDINNALKKVTARSFVGVYDSEYSQVTNDFTIQLPSELTGNVTVLADVSDNGGSFYITAKDDTNTVLVSDYITGYGRFIYRLTVPITTPTTELTLTTTADACYGFHLLSAESVRRTALFAAGNDIANPSVLRLYSFNYEAYSIGDNKYRHWMDVMDLEPVHDWGMADKRVILRQAIDMPLVALLDYSPYSINQVPYPITVDYAFDANEELLLAHLAYNVFARLKSVANMSVENTQWVDAQLMRAKEVIASETRDEDIKRRSTRPSTAEWIYTAGDTYLGDVW